ncbi:double-strand break repair helicase AddA [Paracoccus pacificus]|uniref:DNA 3'-5' helicase n=1 Tax=Paracoccus pacificus TaxID=1463598 RepID=A0ABW4R2T2_9RHOB
MSGDRAPVTPDDATLRQIKAANPALSTWLTANAGSGKTRVLTDRVARLLLAGTDPARILCLTYTKAAASEMQNRLLGQLGKWAMLPSEELRDQLARLGDGGTADLSGARRLFAMAIETPGGLKVQTIHSFCAAVLRRFPLEAGVPHGFTEMDDRSGQLLRAEIVDAMAEQGAPEIDDLVSLVSEGSDAFLAAVAGSRQVLAQPPDPEAIMQAVGLPRGFDYDALIGGVFVGNERDIFGTLIPALTASGANDNKAAAKLLRGDWANTSLAEVEILEDVGLTKTGENAGQPSARFPTKAVRSSAAAIMPDLDDLLVRVAEARPQRLAYQLGLRSQALARFGHAFLTRYDAAKAARGWLDFDDLIERTGRLLSNPALAQWVLFRLDGGIDHILVDEAQDTSPAQWQVIESLTAEFTSGQGVRDAGERTLFVVGDPKQSIYSFQGADMSVFSARREGFSAAFDAVLQPMQNLSLDHSFRSSPAILTLVDRTFEDAGGAGLGGTVRHIAHKSRLPGRVDLWPAVPNPQNPDDADWYDPVDQPLPDAASTVLARALAAQIKDLLDSRAMIADARSGQDRLLRAGDFLILVRKRSRIFHDIITALKAADLPVAGADRLRLGAELAVKDITAVLAFLATPDDDLALAAALRSPLFGLSEDALFRLAHGRGGNLWGALDTSDRHPEAREILTDLRGQAGFMRPYDLISRLLIRHGGRARLLARLGAEAADGINELISQALAYEQSEVPSLTGFLVWLSAGEVEVKRPQGGTGAGLIRVMTVHGAKGLESPVVILPDTGKIRTRQPPKFLERDGRPIWTGSDNARPDSVQMLLDDHRQADLAERRRLLYVATTRAESWLIIAAAGETDDSWYAQIEAGFDRAAGTLDQSLIPMPGGQGGQIRRLSFGDWPADALGAARIATTEVAPDLPAVFHQTAPAMPHPPQPVAASGLGGAKVLAGYAEGAVDAETAMLAGTRLHLLLEHLPGRDRSDWPALARAVLAATEDGLPPEPVLNDLLAEVTALADAPDLAPVFGPTAQVLAEVELTARLPELGGQVLNGIVDRLVLLPDRVLAVDYKTNALIPDDPAGVPLGILRQMAAYRAALRQIYPDRSVECAVLWTRSGRLMDLPDAVMDGALGPSAGLDPARSET